MLTKESTDSGGEHGLGRGLSAQVLEQEIGRFGLGDTDSGGVCQEGFWTPKSTDVSAELGPGGVCQHGLAGWAGWLAGLAKSINNRTRWLAG